MVTLRGRAWLARVPVERRFIVADVQYPGIDDVLELRGERVVLDSDLDTLNGIQTRALLQAVRRHAARFPPDLFHTIAAPGKSPKSEKKCKSRPKRIALTVVQ